MDVQTVLDVLKRRRWTIAVMALLGVLAGSYLFYITPRSYAATAQIMVVRSAGPSVVTAPDMQALAISSDVLAAVKKDAGSKASIDALKNMITIKTTFGSSVIPITFTSTVPREAILGANAEVNELASYYRHIAGTRLNEMSAYLQKALDQKRTQLVAVDRSLQLAAIKNPYNSDANAAGTIAQQILSLEQQRDSLEATMVGDRAGAAAQTRHLKEIQPIVTEEKTSNDPLYQQMRAQEAKDAAQLAFLQAQYTKNPGMPGLQAQVQAEQRQLASEQKAILASPTSMSASYTQALAAKGQMDATIAADDARLSALNSQISQAEDALASVPGMGVKVADLRRQRDILQAEYMSLAQRFGDIVAGEAQEANVGSVDVIDSARSFSATIDKHTMMAIVGSVLGFAVIGVLFAFALELLDGRVRTIAAVENLYGRPVMATVTPE